MKSRKSRKTPTKKSQKLRLRLWTQRCCQIIPEIVKWTLVVYETFGLIFKPLCYMYGDFSDLKNALFTRLVACQKFQTNPFISTQDFCQKLGWGDALLTERATANPFFLEPEIGLCDKPQWTVFLAKNSGLLQWKQRLKFATMTICSTYIFVRLLICDLSNELNTNDDKFTHKMILLSYRKKTWISCYCKKASNSLSLKNE